MPRRPPAGSGYSDVQQFTKAEHAFVSASDHLAFDIAGDELEEFTDTFATALAAE
jgi:hypothetical protein